MRVEEAMCDSGTDSDLESYASMPLQQNHSHEQQQLEHQEEDGGGRSVAARLKHRLAVDNVLLSADPDEEDEYCCNERISVSRSSSTDLNTSSCSSSAGINGLLSSSLASATTSDSAVSSTASAATPGGGASKPHKANDRAWEAIRGVLAQKSSDDSGSSACLRLSDFRLMERLGSGDIGSVYLAELRSGGSSCSSCLFAIKVMDKGSLAARNKLLRAQTEREILESLDHPFLPTLYAHLDERKLSCLVMEFCPGGDLHVLRQRQPSKRFTEYAVRFYAAEVLLALEYLHMMGIVYRDLKPENVLVREDGHIMLSDFDLSLKCTVDPVLWRLASVRQTSCMQMMSSPSRRENAACVLPGLGCVAPCSVHPVASCLPLPRFLRIPVDGSARRKAAEAGRQRRRRPLPEFVAEPTSVRSMSFVGTHEYLAPEIIVGDGHGSAVDWWTFGIFLFELLHGTTPFKGSDNEATLMNVVTQPLRFPPTPDGGDGAASSSSLSTAAQDLIRGLLVKDPLKRLAATRGASHVKQHAFFEGVNWALIRCAIPPEIPPHPPLAHFQSQSHCDPDASFRFESF